jgi:hypothetical protein
MVMASLIDLHAHMERPSGICRPDLARGDSRDLRGSRNAPVQGAARGVSAQGAGVPARALYPARPDPGGLAFFDRDKVVALFDKVPSLDEWAGPCKSLQ